jgi:hypothetical protein
MASGAEHYQAAERLLEQTGPLAKGGLDAALVRTVDEATAHAMLALTAALVEGRGEVSPDWAGALKS